MAPGYDNLLFDTVPVQEHVTKSSVVTQNILFFLNSN